MDPATPDQLYEAFEQLFAAQRRLRGRDAKLPDGISHAQARLLRTLLRDGAMPAGQCATAVSITPAAATQLLDVLEARGLVRRLRSDDDRRVVTVDLTDAGRREAHDARERHRRLFEEALADVGPDDLETGVEILRRCAAYLDTL